MSNPTYFYLRDHLHHRFLVSGSNYDKKVAHWPNSWGRAEAMWRIEEKDDPVINGLKWYRLTDKRHNCCIVSGERADNRAYHYKSSNRPQEFWRIEPRAIGDVNGFVFYDQRHGLSLAAPENIVKDNDHNIYHQVTNNRKNALWYIEVAEKGDTWPSFFNDKGLQIPTGNMLF